MAHVTRSSGEHHAAPITVPPTTAPTCHIRSILLVDDREKKIPPRTYSDAFQVFPARLLVGDVVIIDPRTYNVRAVIEVKTPHDLFRSFATGRLQAQVSRMRDSQCGIRILAVVGGRLDAIEGVLCANYFDNKRLHERYAANLLRLHSRSVSRLCASTSAPVHVHWYRTSLDYMQFLRNTFGA